MLTNTSRWSHARGNEVVPSRWQATDPALVDHVLTALKAPTLRQPPAVEEALGLATRGLLEIISSMRSSVDALEAELAREFGRHPLAPVLRSAPGLGPVLAARVLAELGDDPARFTSVKGVRAFAGTAPVTRASGKGGVQIPV